LTTDNFIGVCDFARSVHRSACSRLKAEYQTGIATRSFYLTSYYAVFKVLAGTKPAVSLDKAR